MPDRLPIYDIESDIIARLKSDRRLILSAPTGSGKSTQVPQMLLQARIAGQRPGGDSPAAPARRAPARRARRAGTGRRAGPTKSVIRSALRMSRRRRRKIRFVTEGVLLRQMIDDPTIARRFSGHLRRVSRTASLRRHHAGPRAGFAGTASARPAPRRHVRHAECGGVGEVSYRMPSAGCPTSNVANSEPGLAQLRIWLLRPFLRRPRVSGRNRISAASPGCERAAGLGTGGGSVQPLCPFRRARATCWCSCRADLKFQPDDRGHPPHAGVEGFICCCRCTANCRRASRTPPSRVTTSRKVVVATNVAETSHHD